MRACLPACLHPLSLHQPHFIFPLPRTYRRWPGGAPRARRRPPRARTAGAPGPSAWGPCLGATTGVWTTGCLCVYVGWGCGVGTSTTRHISECCLRSKCAEGRGANPDWTHTGGRRRRRPPNIGKRTEAVKNARGSVQEKGASARPAPRQTTKPNLARVSKPAASLSASR